MQIQSTPFLTPFDSELWETLRGAYGNVCEEVKIVTGNVKDIPPQSKIIRLDFEEKSDYQIAFDNLYENLTHQLTFYDANYIVMPYLITLLKQKEIENNFQRQFSLICNMGICLACDVYDDVDVSKISGEIIQNYNTSVEILKKSTKRFIKIYFDRLKELNDNDKNFFLTAIMAILGDKKFAHILCLGGWEELEIQCPKCGEYIDFDFADSEYHKIITIPNEKEWDGKNFDCDTYIWYTSLIKSLGLDREARIVSLYYSEISCSECGNKDKVLDFAKTALF